MVCCVYIDVQYLQTINDKLYALSCLTTLNVARLMCPHQLLQSDFRLLSEHIDDAGTLAFRFQSILVTSLGDRASHCWRLPRRRGNKTELLP